MAIWHVIRDGVVENVIEWDGVSEYAPGDGLELQQLGEQVGIGFTLVNKTMVGVVGVSPHAGWHG